MHTRDALSLLDDESLLSSLSSLLRTSRHVTSDIVAHLGEVDERRLHVPRGFSSLFEYCLEELRFSEDEAYRRITVARLARKFPAMLAMLEAGTASVSALALLKHQITPENAEELLALVSGASFRIAKERLAARFPLPPVPDAVRKLPSHAAAGAVQAQIEQRFVPRASFDNGWNRENTANDHPAACAEVVPSRELARSTASVNPRADDAPMAQPPKRAEPSTARVGPAGTVDPLSEDRFLLKVTLTRPARDKLDLARDLMSHRCPQGRLDAVIEAALDTLLEKLERDKFGTTRQPRHTPASATEPATPRANRPTVPRASRRAAIARDGVRCSFVSEDGRRCNARAFLEFDHVTPIGKGGGPEPDNIRVLCRAHNRFAAERAYGRRQMDEAMAKAKQTRNTPDHPLCRG